MIDISTNWGCDSSGKALAYQVQGPEFKPHDTKKLSIPTIIILLILLSFNPISSSVLLIFWVYIHISRSHFKFSVRRKRIEKH
jgi:hypothetical protein